MKMNIDTCGATYNAFRKSLELHTNGTTFLLLEVPSHQPGMCSRVSDLETKEALNKHG
jgi:hypothetical protein